MQFNSTVQAGTGYAPSKVGMKETALIRMFAIRRTRRLDEKKDLNIGDKVALLEKKSLSGKAQGSKWLENAYTVEEDSV